MFKDLKTFTRIAIIGLFVLAIGGYAMLTARNLIAGPVVELIEPKNGENLEEELVAVKGRTKNIVSISLNDHPITVDQQGNFEEKIILAQGYNIIKFEVTDRFGGERDYLFELTHGP